MQQIAKAGENPYAHFFHPQSDEMWELRNTLAVLEDKPFEELVYLERSWDFMVIREEEEQVVNEQGITETVKKNIYADPNGALNGN